jgi:hypothetical protein
MMIGHPLAWVCVGVAASLPLKAFLKSRALFRERSMDDVFPFLRPFDREELQKLFDPEEERLRPFRMSDYRYHREQRVRLDLAREYLHRMIHNARIVHEWASTEFIDCADFPGEYDEATMQLICEQAAMFRIAAHVVLAKIWLFGLLQNLEALHLAPIPKIAPLRRTGSVNLLEIHAHLKDSAALLAFKNYGQEFCDEMNSRM